ncbi:hypothetical protein NL50_09275 [Clostridium acetobutylicum]|nr:hypothetical protein NL50_09275 [Clostridium acetobutylicum]
MELFSEIYSCYYNAVTQIVNSCIKTPISKEVIKKFIDDNAFSESSFHLLPKLLTGDWNLLRKDNDKYISKLNSSIKTPVTKLQKAWLKSILHDKRIKLFLDKAELETLYKSLSDVEPLFDINDFYYFDIFSDGDNYNDPIYINNFRFILNALKNKKAITVSFKSGRGINTNGNFFPIKIEYSSKDDKFRLHCFSINARKSLTPQVINVGRISSVKLYKSTLTFYLDTSIYEKMARCTEPVVIEISNERNALERCMLNFSDFEKYTEYNKTSNKYITHIYYNKNDETELLIRILSFGPVIKVLGPEKFLNSLKKRLKKQLELMNITD